MRKLLKNWWNSIKYDPGDPRYFSGGDIKIVAIGGGTGLPNLLRGLKYYFSNLTAIVTVSDNGASTGQLREEFDILAPGDIRKCISALAKDERLVSNLLEYRFQNGNGFSGHTLGNIWLTALTEYLGSFDKAVEVTTEVFKTAGRVLPATLDNVDLKITYEDGSVLTGEHNLDEVVKKIKRISFSKSNVRAYDKAVTAISEANMIIVGPGSLYGSIIPNLLIKEIVTAIRSNKKAIKVYIANIATERTQTAHYSVEDHIKVLYDYTGPGLFDCCFVNNHIVRKSEDELKLGEIHNITTESNKIHGAEIIRADVIDEQNPLYHDSEKLSRELINLYKSYRRPKTQEIGKVATRQI